MSQAAVEVLPERLQSLVATIDAAEVIDSRSAAQFLAQAGITADDLAAWADYDHPAADSYGRKMVYDGGYFEIMVMSWHDGDMSGIHDHGHTQWGAVQLFGAAEHATFAIEDGRMCTTSRTVCRPDTVLPVDNDLIHQMGNVGQPEYLTLHLYGCPDRDGDVTGDARLYDVDSRAVDVTGGGAFFAPVADAVDRREPGVDADFPTWLRFVTELLQRLLRASGSLDEGTLTPREAALAAKLFDREQWHRLDAELAAIAGDASPLAERYRRILARELLSCARTQQRLLAAGVQGENFSPEALSRSATELTALIETAPPEGSAEFAEQYRAWLRRSLNGRNE
jgi:predicted metal-dependent enzyme (double-stranded beta helix superfamily)